MGSGNFGMPNIGKRDDYITCTNRSSSAPAEYDDVGNT